MDGDRSARARAGNWWHYHARSVALTALCLIAALALLRGIFVRERPDLSVGLVAAEVLAPEDAAALAEGLATLCEDVNGDGRVLVDVEQFALTFDADDNYSSMNERMANLTRLTGSIYASDGANIFLIEDPEGFQRRTGALKYLDGSIPSADDDYDPEGWRSMTLACSDCPGLRALTLRAGARAKLDRLYLGLCAPSPRDDPRLTSATDALWRKLTLS